MDVRPNKRRTSLRNRSVRAMVRGWNCGVIALTSRAGLNAAVGFVPGVVAAIDKFVLHSDTNRSFLLPGTFSVTRMYVPVLAGLTSKFALRIVRHLSSFSL